jgi:uncharacterized membrane protein YcaP (DUF421 family)
MNHVSMWIPDISILEKIARTVAVYAFLLIGLRLAGKREMSQLNSFDLVLLLLLSNTVQNAVIGPDDSLTGGLVGGAVLLALNALVVRALFRAGKLDALEGKPEVLIHKGRVVRRNLERQLITVAELASAARKQGIDSLAGVKECRLETGGALSFLQHHPTNDEQRHHELVDLIAGLEANQRRLLDRLTALEGGFGNGKTRT